MKKPETKFNEKLYDKLAEFKRIWFEKIQQVGKVGTPDTLGCIKCPRCKWGRFFAIESKSDGKKEPEPMQKLKLREIEMSGGYAVKAHPDNLADVIRAIRELESD